ncbi:putative protein OS=Streptomyces sp. ACT-1 OX=1609288 GN=SACT1_3563 PE=4 SV=1 [Streptomyces griseus subsp. griseus]
MSLRGPMRPRESVRPCESVNRARQSWLVRPPGWKCGRAFAAGIDLSAIQFRCQPVAFRSGARSLSMLIGG